ncbi:hypothetical protein JCM3770_006038 [Rhodotorula araucariae]
MDGAHSSLPGFAPPAPAPAPVAPAHVPPAVPAVPPFGAPAPAPAPAPAGAPGMLLPGQSGPKRTNVACSRCRRGKIKCVTVDGELPCQACIARGHDESCVRAEKGRAADDRAPRPRKRPVDEVDGTPSAPAAVAGARRTSFPAAAPGAMASAGAYAASSSSSDKGWSPQATHASLAAPGLALATRDEADGLLPPLPLITAACETFFEGCFQLSFLHRPSFLHQLQTKPTSMSPFLLLAMLAVSARFVPALVAKHGSPVRASDVYAARAHDLVLTEVVEPSVERVQALHLLALHDSAHGCAFRAKVFHGMARQMADALGLADDLPGASVIENEVRRRTWWFLTLDANLVTAAASAPPGSFDPLTASVFLPSQEQEFTFGVESRVKQCFPGATCTVIKQYPTVPGEMSLLGARLAINSIFWRTACTVAAGTARAANATSPAPWQEGSVLDTTERALQSWLAVLSPLQKWSTSNLLAYKSSHLDLAYWAIFAEFHTVHILARRASLARLIRELAPESVGGGAAPAASDEAVPPEGREYWVRLAEELVEHAFVLVDLQEEVAGASPATRGMTPRLAFCLYIAGTTLNYLRICPWLCPTRAPLAPQRVAAALTLLQHLAAVWPIAERWHRALGAQAAILTGGAGVDEAGAGKMDAASALAAMSGAGAAVPPASGPAPAPALGAVPGPPASLGWGGKPASTSAESEPAAAARYSSAVSSLLRPASANASTGVVELPTGGMSTATATATATATFSGLFTPRPDTAVAADAAVSAPCGSVGPVPGRRRSPSAPVLACVDFGDLAELGAYVCGYGAVGALRAV